MSFSASFESRDQERDPYGSQVGDVHLIAKSGKPLARYFPEIAEHLGGLAAKQFVLDGELLIRMGKRYEFDPLQMRLHPAESRIWKLAAPEPKAPPVTG